MVVLRPKTSSGPSALGVFEILFDWVREGRRIYVLGDGSNRYQLLAASDLVEAVVRAADADVAGQVLNVGATEFGTVRTDLQELIDHAGSTSRLTPIPARPAELLLRGLSWRACRRSPSGTTGPRIATPTWTSRRRAVCSTGGRGCRTRRR